MPNVNKIKHPKYESMIDEWIKFRIIYGGGAAFVEEYTKKFSLREDEQDFADRKELTPSPAHAKSAVNDIKNAIFQRTIDIRRSGGADSYREAIRGEKGGVDLTGNGMDGFIGRIILPELLTMSKVGVYIDKPQKDDNTLLIETQEIRPYLYHYIAEDILSWQYDNFNTLVSVLLKDHNDIVDPETGLVTDEVEAYRLLRLTDGGNVTIELFDAEGDSKETTTLEIPRIPFVIMEISDSILTDAASYQIALLNMGSADVIFGVKANFPFYIEPSNPMADMGNMTRSAKPDGTETQGKKSTDSSVSTGVTQGRKIAPGVGMPAFIHPSSEPLVVSMQKQDQMKSEIRELVNLATSNVKAMRASRESKELDNAGLEAGLSNIGLELEHGEREIAVIWAEYESTKTDDIVVTYPSKYSLKTDAERRDDAKEKLDMMAKIPSSTFQKQQAKEAVLSLMGNKLKKEDMDRIIKEIEDSPVVVIDPDIIAQDWENGFVSTETASKVRGYSPDEFVKAKADRAERAKAVLSAQTSPSGIPDVNPDITVPERSLADDENPTIKDKK